MSTSETQSFSPPSRIRFGTFELDVADRQLWNGSTRVDLSARYLDALILLVSEPSRLIEKDRFFDEVWGDVVVSDSALSQCIKELRRVLEDDVSNPRFIQTVPRHGYRFVAKVEGSALGATNHPKNSSELIQAAQYWAAGSAGGALIVGSGAKMLGMDAFHLLLGQAPEGMTGGPEGAALGLAVALGLILAPRLTVAVDHWRPFFNAGTMGAVAGVAITLLGGHLMGGSLKLLADSVQESRLQIDAVATLFGGVEFSLATEAVLAGFEGMLLCAGVAGALAWFDRRFS